MSASIYQLKLNASIDAVFQCTETPNAAPAEPQTLVEARKASAESGVQFQAAINKVFAALQAPDLTPAASEPQPSAADLPADFQPKSAGRGSGRRLIEVQPHWSR